MQKTLEKSKTSKYVPAIMVLLLSLAFSVLPVFQSNSAFGYGYGYGGDRRKQVNHNHKDKIVTIKYGDVKAGFDVKADFIEVFKLKNSTDPAQKKMFLEMQKIYMEHKSDSAKEILKLKPETRKQFMKYRNYVKFSEEHNFSDQLINNYIKLGQMKSSKNPKDVKAFMDMQMIYNQHKSDTPAQFNKLAPAVKNSFLMYKDYITFKESK